jgi:hypothetical protein
MNQQNERPPAQERWIVCYDLECAAISVLGYLELCANPESQDMVPELIKQFCEKLHRLF